MQKNNKVHNRNIGNLHLTHFIYQLSWKYFHKPEVVFYAGNPLEYVMFKEIHKFLPEVKIICNTKNKKKQARKYLNSIGVPYYGWWRFPQILITAHFVNSLFNIPEIKKITIFHGMAKGVMFDSRNDNIDLSLIMGEYAAKKFEELGRRYEIVGYPKIDRLFDGNIDTDYYRRKLGIDNDRKTILYAPSWNQGGSLEHLCDQLSTIGEGYNFLVKLHDKSVASWRLKIREHENVIIIDDPDIVPYYLLADVMISDYSSVIFEYAVLDKPIILFNSKVRVNQDSICCQWRDIGINVENVTELQEAIKRSLDNPQEFSIKRQYYTEQLFKYRDGLSAKRAAEKIVEFCKENGVNIELKA